MKYIAPVAELVSVDSVSVICSSTVTGGCCGDAVTSSTVDEDL